MTFTSRILMLAFLVLATATAFANRVVVYGTVNYTNGAIAVGYPVVLRPLDSALCKSISTTLTTPNGAYEVAVSCDSAIQKVVLMYPDCEGKMQTLVKEVPSGNIIQYNIVLCQPTTCFAFFSWRFTSDTTRNIRVSSGGSATTQSLSDSIVSRRWSWGDGTVTEGNRIDPDHTYAKDSTYHVCLTITSRNGCSATYCDDVKVFVTAGTCEAYFNATPSALATSRQWNFVDSSSTSRSDSIVKRTWYWGDGYFSDGNNWNISHTYAADNTYNVCLIIRAGNGCISKYCKEITVVSQPVPCKAGFTWLLPGTNSRTINFKDTSTIAVGDSIIKRTWRWGDGNSTDGNLANPTHLYTKDSIYNVCLVITTKNSCVSEYCQKVNVQVVASVCKALFGYAKAAANTREIYFYDSSKTSPGDTIISRTWHWGDGTLKDGNTTNLTHAYSKDSIYNVCLVVKTASGCISEYCQKITIATPVTVCKAGFSWVMASNNTRSVSLNDTSKTAVADTVIKRIWHWGDGSSTDGNLANPVHLYARDSTYNVCLVITTTSGCTSEYCQKVMVQVKTTECKAWFGFVKAATNTRECYFTDSSKASVGDSIISRTWNWGDGTVTDGNLKNPVHTYTRDSVYNVCLKITTRGGCESVFCQLVEAISKTTVVQCEPGFVYRTDSLKVYFNSAGSVLTPGDSIVKRIWKFGDSTYIDSNRVDPAHVYAMPGQYQVCLRIFTKMGCEKTVCQLVTVGNTYKKCVASWSYDNRDALKLYFSSNTSYAATASDSIVRRNWVFGDGYTNYGNTAYPVHEYKTGGTYTVCLTIATLAGCESLVCKEVLVKGPVVADSSDVTLVNCFPNPANQTMYANVWSKQSSTQATLFIYDRFGNAKWSREIMLPAGRSTWNVPTGFLSAGYYNVVLRSKYGTKHLNFIRLN